MSLPEIRPAHVFILLALFWIAWAYTEITELVERDAVYEEVMDFVGKGDRFTQEEGNELTERVRKLEEE